MDPRRRDSDSGPTAGPVVLGIALGVAPLPLLAVYAVLFIAHGTLFPVNPPDISGSKTGELVAGVAALLLFVLITLAIAWFLNRRRRWPFIVAQAAALGAAVDFLVDGTSGPAGVPSLLALTSAAALGIALHPVSAQHVHGGRRREAAESQERQSAST